MRFTPVNRNCRQCGTIFRITRKVDADRIYCGSSCYRVYEAIHGRPNPTVKLNFTCAKCGKPFEHNPGHVRSYREKFGRDPLYCSRKCGWEGKRRDEGKPCIVCGTVIPAVWNDRPGSTPRVSNRRVKICSSECRSKYKLAEHEERRPAESREIQRNITRDGYVRLRFPNKYGIKGREVLEHRLVVERAIGRTLLPEETVHHISGDKTDNRYPENLELFSSRHGPGQRVVDKIAFAIEMIRLYPEFLSDTDRSELASLLDHAAKVSRT